MNFKIKYNTEKGLNSILRRRLNKSKKLLDIEKGKVKQFKKKVSIFTIHSELLGAKIDQVNKELNLKNKIILFGGLSLVTIILYLLTYIFAVK